MSMASTLLDPTAEPLTSSSKESMSTTMRPLEESTCQEPSWWTWSLAPWIPSDLDLLGKSSDLTTLSLDNLELATTGPRDTTLRARSWLTLSLMLSARRVNPVIASRASNSPTPWEVALDLAWELSSSQRSEKNILTGS